MKKLKKLINRQNLVTLGIFLIAFLLLVGLFSTRTERNRFVSKYLIPYTVKSSERTVNTGYTQFNEEAYNTAVKDYNEFKATILKECHYNVDTDSTTIPKTGDILEDESNRSKSSSCFRGKLFEALDEGKSLSTTAPKKETYTEECKETLVTKKYRTFGFTVRTTETSDGETCPQEESDPYKLDVLDTFLIYKISHVHIISGDTFDNIHLYGLCGLY